MKDKKTGNILIAVLMLLLSGTQVFGQGKKTMKEYSLDELSRLAAASYLINGSTSVTARIIFTGLRKDPLNLNMLRNVADFFTENNNDVAAVVYYYIYTNIDKLGKEDKDHFMIMFSDAMYQFGLSKTKSGIKPTTLGEIYDYSNFDFDIEGLKKHTEMMISDFDSIEDFIKIIGSTIGIISDFVEKPKSEDLTQMMPENVALKGIFSKWLGEKPSEIIKLEKKLAGMKK